MEENKKKKRPRKHRYYGEDYSILHERREKKDYVPIADRHIDGA